MDRKSEEQSARISTTPASFASANSAAGNLACANSPTLDSSVIKTPIGNLLASAKTFNLNENKIVSIMFEGKYCLNNDSLLTSHRSRRLNLALQQLEEELNMYFSGELKKFSVPISLVGTEFQTQAWSALQRIPYGETRSYSEQALAINNPRAVRAVGTANGANPIPILVPCHRVIAKNGTLAGFGGGLSVKQFLLDLERTHSQS
jgi:O-6-methylguanine DNA methyltransferase